MELSQPPWVGGQRLYRSAVRVAGRLKQPIPRRLLNLFSILMLPADNFTYANFGPKWTCDWVSYVTDNPQSPQADVNYFIRGGGTRAFTGFNN